MFLKIQDFFDTFDVDVGICRDCYYYKLVDDLFNDDKYWSLCTCDSIFSDDDDDFPFLVSCSHYLSVKDYLLSDR